MSLYEGSVLETALGVPARDVRAIIERAVARPVTPIYSELSDTLQIHLHRALTRQAEPRDALRLAAMDMRRALERSGLAAAAP
jgi:hypothetical protein